MLPGNKVRIYRKLGSVKMMKIQWGLFQSHQQRQNLWKTRYAWGFYGLYLYNKLGIGEGIIQYTLLQVVSAELLMSGFISCSYITFLAQ